MNPDALSDDQLDDLARQLAPRLPTGTHGDRVVLSRRQFGAAASGTLGVGALMALGVDEASAQAAGQVGTSSEPVDAYAYDLNVANGVTSALPMGGNDIQNAGAVGMDSATVQNGVEAGSVSADDTDSKRVSGNQHYASEYNGVDVDARLDNVLAVAQDGDRIWLEPGGEYNNDRTINTQVMFCGAAEAAGDSPRIFGDWTTNTEFISFKHIRIDGSLTINQTNTIIGGSNPGAGDIIVDGDNARIALVRDGTVTFNSGTSGGVIDSSTGVDVVDNGTNTVGDLG